MKTLIATTFAAAMLAASSMAHAQQMEMTDDPNVTIDEQTTGSIIAPDGTYDLRTYCNSTPDDAKCRANNMGETTKGN